MCMAIFSSSPPFRAIGEDLRRGPGWVLPIHLLNSFIFNHLVLLSKLISSWIWLPPLALWLWRSSAGARSAAIESAFRAGDVSRLHRFSGFRIEASASALCLYARFPFLAGYHGCSLRAQSLDGLKVYISC